MQAGRYQFRQAGKQACIQIGMNGGGYAGGWAGMHVIRQPAVRQTGRQVNRQAGMHT
jgi:hypothetical protein